MVRHILRHVQRMDTYFNLKKDSQMQLKTHVKKDGQIQKIKAKYFKVSSQEKD